MSLLLPVFLAPVPPNKQDGLTLPDLSVLSEKARRGLQGDRENHPVTSHTPQLGLVLMFPTLPAPATARSMPHALRPLPWASQTRLPRCSNLLSRCRYLASHPLPAAPCISHSLPSWPRHSSLWLGIHLVCPTIGAEGRDSFNSVLISALFLLGWKSSVLSKGETTGRGGS